MAGVLAVQSRGKIWPGINNKKRNTIMNFILGALPDPATQLTLIEGYATNAIVAGVAIAGAWMGWKLIKRFIRG